MGGIDFGLPWCQQWTRKQKFGLYDVEDGSPARLEHRHRHLWNAVILNPSGFHVRFTAIDNCIGIYRANGELERRCDCMLTYRRTMVLIELKNKRESWQQDGLMQIEAVLLRMKRDNREFYDRFPRRRAIVANAKHRIPLFQSSNLAQREYFMRRYRTRIQFVSEILLD